MQQTIAEPKLHTQIINWLRTAPPEVQLTFIKVFFLSLVILGIWGLWLYARSPHSNWIPGASKLTRKG